MNSSFSQRPYADTPMRRHCSSSFTLIEMLVVIAIIVLLAALTYPVILGARERARNRQAMAEACNIATALKMFKLEHGKWPNQTQGTNDTTYFSNNYLVINFLTIPMSNQRNKVYLSFQTNSLDEAGNYADPWGVPYVIFMDENGDRTLKMYVNAVYSNRLTHEITNYCYTNFPSRNTRIGAAAASIGNTNTVICSWEEID